MAYVTVYVKIRLAEKLVEARPFKFAFQQRLNVWPAALILFDLLDLPPVKFSLDALPSLHVCYRCCRASSCHECKEFATFIARVFIAKYTPTATITTVTRTTPITAVTLASASARNIAFHTRAWYIIAYIECMCGKIYANNAIYVYIYNAANLLNQLPLPALI